MRAVDIVPVMEQKAAVANYYGTLLKRLDRRRDVFAALPELRKDEVRAAGEWVTMIVSENARMLRAAADANERLLVAIKEAAEEHYGGATSTYTRIGRMDNAARRDPTVRVSLGVEERV